jgi:hypothetical protein
MNIGFGYAIAELDRPGIQDFERRRQSLMQAAEALDGGSFIWTTW